MLVLEQKYSDLFNFKSEIKNLCFTYVRKQIFKNAPKKTNPKIYQYF